MKHTIKVNLKNTLTQSELDSIIEDKNTINLTNMKSTWQKIKHAKQKLKNRLKKQLYISLLVLFIVLWMNVHVYNSNALEVKIEEVFTSEFEKVLEKEEIIDEDVENLVKILQESVDKEILTTDKENLIVHKTDEEIIQETIKFLHEFEWVRFQAYWDYKQFSICYWTESYKWEIATQDECDERLRERIQTELLRINRLADNLEWNKKVALISFFYNTWFKIDVLNYAARWDDKSVIYLISLYNKAWWEKLQWLVNRRYAEIEMYKNK